MGKNEMLKECEAKAQFIQDVLEDLGTRIGSGSVILDFGCGAGWLVYQFRKKGIRAYGVDVSEFCKRDIREWDAAENRCKQEHLCELGERIFRVIHVDEYKIPFEDDTFDVIFSDQVFEHIRNYPESVAEIKRVLKKRGSSLHIFPSRYRPIEVHVRVPFATIIRNRSYLAFWASLGIRNSFQKGASWREVTRGNDEFLRNYTTYYSKGKLKKIFLAEFGNVSFVESVFLNNSMRFKQHKIICKLPLVAYLFSTFHTRVIFCEK
jgi:SAM-dependent methyltransferase